MRLGTCWNQLHLRGWTSSYQLSRCSPGYQVFWSHCHMLHPYVLQHQSGVWFGTRDEDLSSHCLTVEGHQYMMCWVCCGLNPVTSCFTLDPWNLGSSPHFFEIACITWRISLPMGEHLHPLVDGKHHIIVPFFRAVTVINIYQITLWLWMVYHIISPNIYQMVQDFIHSMWPCLIRSRRWHRAAVLLLLAGQGSP